MTVEAETGAMWLQANEHLGTPGARRDRKGPRREPSEGGSPTNTWILNFWPAEQ